MQEGEAEAEADADECMQATSQDQDVSQSVSQYGESRMTFEEGGES